MRFVQRAPQPTREEQSTRQPRAQCHRESFAPRECPFVFGRGKRVGGAGQRVSGSPAALAWPRSLQHGAAIPRHVRAPAGPYQGSVAGFETHIPIRMLFGLGTAFPRLQAAPQFLTIGPTPVAPKYSTPLRAIKIVDSGRQARKGVQKSSGAFVGNIGRLRDSRPLPCKLSCAGSCRPDPIYRPRFPALFQPSAPTGPQFAQPRATPWETKARAAAIGPTGQAFSTTGVNPIRIARRSARHASRTLHGTRPEMSSGHDARAAVQCTRQPDQATIG